MYPSAQEKLEIIADRYSIDTIYVFGSRAQEIAKGMGGEIKEIAQPESDVDIGVQIAFGSRLSAREKVMLSNDLEELFGVPKVDLAFLHEVGTFLALDIIRGEILYCKNLDDQAENELLILRRAGDLAYYERLRRKQAFLGNNV
ncbi:MAG: hypothetical protein JW755_14015 [Candidatus Aminicenantes bacterium]|nr:hypothetical protein [Candidatus Aminicenantes bacterium]